MTSPPNAPRNVTSVPNIAEEHDNFNPGLGETAIVLLALILSAPTKHIYNFLESSYDIEGKDNFASLLMQFFKVAISILDNDAWPSTWLNVNILAHKVLIKMMDPVATLLKGIFIPPASDCQQFKSDLWHDAFHMLFKLLSSDQLVIEDFTAQVRATIPTRLLAQFGVETSCCLASWW
jgi:dedicator of cytokinesis protein 3